MRPGPRHPLLALRRTETEALCAAEGLDGARRPVATPIPASSATGCATRCCRCSPRWPGATWCRCWPARPTCSPTSPTTSTAAAAALDVTDAPALRAAPPAAGPGRGAGLAAARAGRRAPAVDAATVERVLAVAAGEAVATEVAGGWRVRRSHQRLAWPAGRPLRPAPCDEPDGAGRDGLTRPVPYGRWRPIPAPTPAWAHRGQRRRSSPTGSPSSARRSPATTPGGPRCWSACSRAPSCSWPTWPGPSTCRWSSTSWPCPPTAAPPSRAAWSAS